jgi:hypothetical protein
LGIRLGAPVWFACVCRSIGSRRKIRLISLVIMQTTQEFASFVCELHCEDGRLDWWQQDDSPAQAGVNH